jgi:hypothetical protein
MSPRLFVKLHRDRLLAAAAGTCPRLVGSPARLYVIGPQSGAWASIVSDPSAVAHYRGKPELRIREFVEVEPAPRMEWIDALLVTAAVLGVVGLLLLTLWVNRAEAGPLPTTSCASNPPVATVDLPDGSTITVSSAVYFPSDGRIVLSGADCVFADGFES